MKKRVILIAALTVLVVFGLGCAVTSLVDRLVSPDSTPLSSLISIELPTSQQATPYPTLTPRPATPSATAGPSTFRIELTENDISDLVGEEGFSQDGLKVTNLRTTITPQQVIATFDATHADSGLSGEMTVIGVPQVIDGKLYLQVVDFRLGSTFTGFTRLIANALVEQALAAYNTGNGIPVPLEDVGTITGVELQDGKVIVTGTYR